MGLLFVLLAVVAALIFLVVPFWVAVGYLVVLAWSAFLLSVIFYRPDPVSEAVAKLQAEPVLRTDHGMAMDLK